MNSVAENTADDGTMFSLKDEGRREVSGQTIGLNLARRIDELNEKNLTSEQKRDRARLESKKQLRKALQATSSGGITMPPKRGTRFSPP